MRRSISTQTMALCLCLVLFPTILITVYSSERIRSVSFDLMVGRLKGNLYLVAEDFRQVVLHTRTSVKLISQADVFEGDDALAQAAYLDELRTENPSMSDLALFDLDGVKRVGASGEGVLPTDALQADRRIAEIFQAARAGRQGDAFVAYGAAVAGRPAIVLAAPVTDDANVTVIKVIMVYRAIDALRAKLDNLKDQGYPDVAYSLVVDGADIALSTDPAQDEAAMFADANVATFLAEKLTRQNAGGHAVLANEADQRILTIYSPVHRPDGIVRMQWDVVACVSLERIEAPILGVRTDALAIALGCAALGTLIGLFAARRITLPLRRLMLLTQRLDAGGPANAVVLNGPEEVKVLGKALVGAFGRAQEHAARLEHSTAALNQAQQLALIGSWHRDQESGATWLSDEAYRLFGYARDNHRPSIDLLRQRILAEDLDRIDATLAAARVERRPVIEMEYRIRRDDGATGWIRAITALEFDDAGALRAMRGVFQDITTAKNIEAQLRQAQKMEAVGQLTGGIAHDFNNLLGVIIGNVELAADVLPEHDPSRRNLEEALIAGERGAQLTHSLLAFSRRQPLQPRVINLNTTLQSMREILNRTLGEQIEINIVAAAGLWLCEVDPAQMESALLNLALNARDAMPDGGKLTIETGNAWLDDEYAAQEVDVAPGQYVMIAVSDTGVGMSEEVRSSAVDPFFTTKGVGAGTGLGLSMVHGFVKQTRGNIKIYSEIGEGTTIKIYLPRSHVARSDPAPPRGLDDTPRSRGEHVLVVEDDEKLLALAATMLRGLGYIVFEAANGEEALRIAGSDERIDALLCDVVLPGGWNGRTLAARLHEQRPELPVLFMSGYTANAIVHQNRVDVGVNLLQKPFRRAELARAMRKALEG